MGVCVESCFKYPAHLGSPCPPTHWSQSDSQVTGSLPRMTAQALWGRLLLTLISRPFGANRRPSAFFQSSVTRLEKAAMPHYH